jgi:hypothetical protein
MTIVHNNLQPALIPTQNCSEMSINVLVVEATVRNSKIRFINSYGVQETSPAKDKADYYSTLEEEIQLTLDAGCMLCWETDANAKMGPDYIKGDPHEITPNGKLLLSLIERHNLVIVNGTDKCAGIITRMRRKGNIIEKSVIDFFIVCQTLFQLVTRMEIDEDRNYVLTKFSKYKGKTHVIKSDHNPLKLEVNISWNMKIVKQRVELYNLRNSECQKSFYEFTSKSDMLTKSLIEKDVRTGGRMWIKNLKYIIMQTFRKIRINKKDKSTLRIEKLVEERFCGIYTDKSVIDQEIANQIFERNRKLIIDQVCDMSDITCNLSRVKMWKVKQKVCPKIETAYPVAKLDHNGNLVSNRDELKKLYSDTYKERLRHRDINPNYAQLKQLKETLFSLRLRTAKLSKTNPWSEKDLLKVTSKLKSKKAADPMGLVFELFRPEVAGCDLLQSLLQLCNQVKAECDIPKFLELTNISSIFKKKGRKSDLNNDRGVFNVMTVRSIIDNLVYNDFYDIIDASMSDSNVGGRRNRNIRDNLFIVYGIINYVIEEKLKVDMTLYDLAKCFESMWYHETMNDLWDAGVQDDKFALISKMNKSCNIAVKTPVGITDRFQLEEIEMQGTKLSNIKCAVQIDTLGKDCYSNNEGLFLYKECVTVPPLGMIDDLVSFSECGPETVKINALINAKIESKKLEFGHKKCFKIHIGNRSEECVSQKVHSDEINVASYETYLGDIVCSSGSNDRNIANRYNQGIGSVSQIDTMLNRTSLGHYHFEIGLIMIDTILVSKLVHNSEVWYNVADKQISKLEQIDEMLFRKLFSLAQSAPREGMYIECGKMPIRFIVMMRRLMFYWHILHKDESELLYRFMSAQQLSTSPNDWIQQVRKNMSDIKLYLTEAQIKNMSKDVFRSKVKHHIEMSAVKYLNKLKHSHSKTSQLVINGFSPAQYMFSPLLDKEQVKVLYKLRNQMIDVKCNFGSFYKHNMWCRTCFLFPESQQHLLQCSAIVNRMKNVINFSSLKYDMIFDKTENQVKITQAFSLIIKTRLVIIEETRNSP